MASSTRCFRRSHLHQNRLILLCSECMTSWASPFLCHFSIASTQWQEQRRSVRPSPILVAADKAGLICRPHYWTIEQISSVGKARGDMGPRLRAQASNSLPPDHQHLPHLIAIRSRPALQPPSAALPVQGYQRMSRIHRPLLGKNT
jgi:hypothetical protein